MEEMDEILEIMERAKKQEQPCKKHECSCFFTELTRSLYCGFDKAFKQRVRTVRSGF